MICDGCERDRPVIFDAGERGHLCWRCLNARRPDEPQRTQTEATGIVLGRIAMEHGPDLAESLETILDELGMAVYYRKREYKSRRQGPRLSTGQRRAMKAAEDEGFREVEYRPKKRADKARAQQSTVDTATHRGGQWTGAELEVAARTDLSAREVAAMLGRTYHGVMAARHRIRHDPKTRDVAGVTDDQHDR